jgi:hypothetical protein
VAGDEGADWQALAASIMSGLGHDLNGRVTALLGIAHFARSGEAIDPGLLADLEHEVNRLRRTAILFRRVPWFTSGEPRLDRVLDVVRDVAQLFYLASGSEVVVAPENGGGPFVWIATPTLARALLFLLSASGRATPLASRRVSVPPSPEGLERIEIEAYGGLPAVLRLHSLPALLEGRQLIESLGGQVVADDEPSDGVHHRIVISLPTTNPSAQLPPQWEG